MAHKPRPVAMVTVVNPDGEEFTMTVANARDCVRAMGFKYKTASDEPKELEQIVGEQRSIEDAVQTPLESEGTEGDPTPDDVEPEVSGEDEEEKSRSKGRRK